MSQLSASQSIQSIVTNCGALCRRWSRWGGFHVLARVLHCCNCNVLPILLFVLQIHNLRDSDTVWRSSMERAKALLAVRPVPTCKKIGLLLLHKEAFTNVGYLVTMVHNLGTGNVSRFRSLSSTEQLSIY